MVGMKNLLPSQTVFTCCIAKCLVLFLWSEQRIFTVSKIMPACLCFMMREKYTDCTSQMLNNSPCSSGFVIN